jgi:hypothetical protein
MKSLAMLSLTVMFSVALAVSAYAVQGQTDTGGVSGQPSGSTTQPSASDRGMQPGSPVAPAPGTSVAPATAARTQTIEGEVLRIEGSYYIVKDVSGKEVRLHVDNNTKLDGNISANDKVVARASEMPAADKTDQPAVSDRPATSDRPAKSAWHAESIKKK